MGASHTIKLGQEHGQDIKRGTEATTASVDEFVLITDQNDRLYCPGVDDEPSDWLVNSIRKGWEKGETIKCVNRGKKGGALVLVIADGRSRLKATRIVNAERERDGLPPIRPEFVLLTEDEAYEAMHLSHNKQERKPTFDARCWAQFKRVFALEKFGKAALEDSEVREARKAYAELRKCSSSQIKAWELILSAHPEVLRMFDAGERGLNRAAVIDIVNSTAYAEQPEAARKVIELAKRKDVPAPEVVRVEEPAPDVVVAEPAQLDKPSRGTRSERSDRREALGIGTPRPITAKKLGELLSMLNTIDVPDMVDPRVMIAMVLGQTEFDGLPIADHPSMGEVVKMAKRVGIKVTK
jgi:hypothetical protein